MRPTLHSQILTGAKVYDLGSEGILIYHNVIRFYITVNYAQFVVEVLQAHQYLSHNGPYFSLFIQPDQALVAFFLYVLGETHVHVLENNIKSPVLKFDTF